MVGQTHKIPNLCDAIGAKKLVNLPANPVFPTKGSKYFGEGDWEMIWLTFHFEFYFSHIDINKKS